MMYFTFEEQNLVAMQSCTERRKAMLGLYNTLGILKDPDLIEMTRQVSLIGKQPFAKWGNIGHNKAEELNDTTDLTTKGARLDA